VRERATVRNSLVRNADGVSYRPPVPILWDTKEETIVNNESSEIIRMFNSGFDSLLPADKQKLDFYPKELRNEIDELNEW
jgi:glutathionyl-hydroquinone reductase